MPYNTRRKSLSLSSLGIHVPVSNAERAAAAAANRASALLRESSSSSRSNTRTSSPTSMASPSEDQPPTRKPKRAHAFDGDDSEPARKKREGSVRFNTPPPSPGAKRRSTKAEDSEDGAEPRPIDMESINDEIVEAVVLQLQNTGNRPHIVKELAAVLMQHLKIVQQSANACAIISSRLASYLKRSCWSAKSPCPLAKELETAHPRRTHFYLTTCPRQPLPDPAQAAALSQLAHLRTIVTPSLSSSASSSEDADMERRRELSPSPEVDLSSPEFDDMDDDMPMPSTPVGSLSLRGFGVHPRHYANGGVPGRSNRATSPALEKDEKEFTQTADGLQQRKLQGDLLSSTASANMEVDYYPKSDSALFGEKLTGIFGSHNLITSPPVRPSTSTMSLNLGKRDMEADGWAKLESMLEWDRSPENIELEELDGLLNGY